MTGGFYHETFSAHYTEHSVLPALQKKKYRQCFYAGMTGMRLNLSHSNLDDCEDWLQQYHEVSERMHIIPELLVDLQGPELRIGTLDTLYHFLLEISFSLYQKSPSRKKKKIQIFFPVFLMAKMNFLLSHVRKFSSLILMKSRKSALMMEKLF